MSGGSGSERQLVFKIMPRAQWEAAEREGVYHGSKDDQRDGFIHFSLKSQVGKTLLRHFSGQHDLLLISFDPAALGEALRYESSRDGQLFPHLYGPLATSLALEIVELA
ncbi:MAG: dihydroorotate dehydrogenase [Myxococcaceae bacterium]|nr:dihydroorotate dehydrogenase [Myxococcaceae bacterium]